MGIYVVFSRFYRVEDLPGFNGVSALSAVISCFNDFLQFLLIQAATALGLRSLSPLPGVKRRGFIRDLSFCCFSCFEQKVVKTA